MQRFLLQENARHFRARLEEAATEDERRQIRTMLATVERELALLEAAKSGVRAARWPVGGAAELQARRKALIEDFHREFDGSDHVAYLIDPAPGLVFVDVNPAFELATGVAREQAIGQPLFLLFPENPDDLNADGLSHVYASLRRVAETGAPHAMPIVRYDVRGPDGVFVERHWRPVNAPLHDEEGRLSLLLHVVDEVSDEVQRSRRSA